MKNNKKVLLSIVLTFVMIVSCLAVPSNSMKAEAAGKLKATCSKALAVNCKTTIKTNKKAAFQSSNKKIATVNSKGIVTGKKAGTAKITVTAKEIYNSKNSTKENTNTTTYRRAYYRKTNY